MSTIYYVVLNVGEHSGYTGEIEENELWSNENESGYTWQQLSGSHGAASQFETKEEAEAFLEEWSKCPRAERGGYCYTHNPS